ncbi:SpoIIE family protein phosphatase [Petroclostridium sp. X23]|uniref:SpoIIE family protein phosphatase n=1 Tax=Petroclostridium sp. X23 TaxID=3045146 RepID=UPI0024ACB560|nr:SpoIIE family protein phosphatase [Petroclostridium sp. X23]WHH61367.1 SpoIIE family protein phosphatase [Petroclostridium sp. X23]
MDPINEYEVRGTYDIGFIRRQIADKMKSLNFSDKEISEVSIVVSELCSNIIKHNAVDGKIRFFEITERSRVGIEIVAEDKGPGIEDIDEVLKDGVSSKGTMGGGFGAIRRFSDFFEIRSNTKDIENKGMLAGTMITVRKWRFTSIDASGTGSSEIKVSVMSRPHTGFSVNGDCYYTKGFGDREIIAVVDGLGHGMEAHEAASRAVKIIDENIHCSIDEIIRNMNMALKNTRGAVVALVIIYKFINEFEMISIGNIDCRYIAGGTTEKLLSYNGYVGAYRGSCKARKHNYNKGDILVLCSDGISSKWEIDRYSHGIINSPSVLCSTVFKEHARQNDDATMLVAVL